MSQLTAPIIVTDRDGNVSLYASPGAAEADLESIDVEAGEYCAFDSEGRRLAFEVRGRGVRTSDTALPFGLRAVDSLPIRIRVAEVVPRHQVELTRVLRAALDASGGDAVETELPALIDLALLRLSIRG